MSTGSTPLRTNVPPSLLMAHRWPVADRVESILAKQREADTGSAVDPFAVWLRKVDPSWQWDADHLAYVREHLERVTSGETTRLIITMPPRHGKTEHTTIRYAAWRMERDPGLRVIITSYNQHLATEFSRKIRRIVRDRVGLASDRAAAGAWDSATGSSLRAAGVGSGVTGLGANLIIIDDPIKSRLEADSARVRDSTWNWFTDDLYTRLEPGGAIILILTRWHEDDLAGRILASDDGPNWEVVHLPALAVSEDDPLGRAIGTPLWEDRFNAEELEAIRQATADRTWWSLYQGMPQPDGGSIYLREWWQGRNRYQADDRRLLNSTVARIISWDTAESTSDDAAYSAAAVIDVVPWNRGYAAILREVWRGRVAFADLLQSVESLARRWNQDEKLSHVIIENASSGRAGVQMLRLQAPSWLAPLIQPFPVHQSKDERARVASVPMRNGRFWLPEPSESTPWLFDFEDELYAVPSGRFRDQTDATAQGVIFLQNYLREPGDVGIEAA